MTDPMVTIGAFSTSFEANLVKSELEAFEVDAMLADAGMVNLNWLWSNVIGGVKVQVPASQLEEAHRILSLQNPDEDAAAPDPAIVCPACGGHQSHYYLDKRSSCLSWLILGVPIFPAVSKRLCDACGNKWKT